MALTPSELGTAGEHRVVSELLLRGHRPLLAVVDDGVDITLASGVTIQVKTANRPVRQNGGVNLYYVFTLHSTLKRGGRRYKTRRAFVADFLILWCVKDDKFYIIPAEKVGSRTSISIAAKPLRAGGFLMYENDWSQLGKAD